MSDEVELLPRQQLVPLMVLATVGAVSIFMGSRHNGPNHPVILPTWAIANFVVLPMTSVVFLYGRRHWGARALALLGAAISGTIVFGWAYFTDDFKPLMKSTTSLAAVLGSLGLVLAACKLAGVELQEWAFGLGDWRWWLPRLVAFIVALFVVLPVAALIFPELAEFYPRYKPARRGSVEALLVFNLGMLGYMFAWEFFNRAFLLEGMARYLGKTAAIIIQAYPFFLLHDFKPEPEMISSWFGGLLMGWLSFRARSFWPGVVLHWLLYAGAEIVGFFI